MTQFEAFQVDDDADIAHDAWVKFCVANDNKNGELAAATHDLLERHPTLIDEVEQGLDNVIRHVNSAIRFPSRWDGAAWQQNPQICAEDFQKLANGFWELTAFEPDVGLHFDCEQLDALFWSLSAKSFATTLRVVQTNPPIPISAELIGRIAQIILAYPTETFAVQACLCEEANELLRDETNMVSQWQRLSTIREIQATNEVVPDIEDVGKFGLRLEPDTGIVGRIDHNRKQYVTTIISDQRQWKLLEEAMKYDVIPVRVLQSIIRCSRERSDVAANLRRKLTDIGLTLDRWKLKEISVF